MGNEQSKKNHDVQIELNHSRMNYIRVVNDPKRRYMQAKFAVQKNDYNAWKASLQKAKINSNHLLLPFQHSFQSKQFCGSAGSVQVKYENYPYLLLDQIENRRAKKKRFDETQLWLLLYCLLDAKKQMRSGTGSIVGDIRPQNIFFNQQGLMKVANLLSWPNQTTNYQKFLENEPTYLALEDMLLIQSSNISNSENTQSQIFSIGLTILSAANLVDYKILYNTTARRFNIEEFTNIVNEWRLNDYYSDIFKATLCSLLQTDLHNRITEDFLFPWIQKYREEILARKDFVITDPPQLIINQVQVIRKLYQNVGSNYTYVNPIAPVFNSDIKKFGLPLQGSRRLVEQKRYPPIQVIPGSTISESIYHSVQKPTYMSNYLLQGAPITSLNPQFVNRGSVPTALENQQLAETTYVGNYSSQGVNVPRTNFEYSSSPERTVQYAQGKVPFDKQERRQQENNQPEIQEDKNPQGETQKNE